MHVNIYSVEVGIYIAGVGGWGTSEWDVDKLEWGEWIDDIHTICKEDRQTNK